MSPDQNIRTTAYNEVARIGKAPGPAGAGIEDRDLVTLQVGAGV